MGDGVTQPGRNRAINTEQPTPNLEPPHASSLDVGRSMFDVRCSVFYAHSLLEYGLSSISSTMLIAFHKPYGVVSQFTRDRSGYRTLDEFAFPPRVYPIGRLDADSEGLLLLSDE